MFWNLVRYEFKNVNKWFLALYAAVLSLSVIIGIQGSSLSSTYYQDKGVVMLVFLSLVFGGLVITLSISTLILIIQRFKGSVYDRRGYLLSPFQYLNTRSSPLNFLEPLFGLWRVQWSFFLVFTLSLL